MSSSPAWATNSDSVQLEGRASQSLADLPPRLVPSPLPACTHRKASRTGSAHSPLVVGHESYVTFCQLENETAFTCSADCTIRSWDVRTGQCLQVYRGHTSIVNRSAWWHGSSRQLCRTGLSSVANGLWEQAVWTQELQGRGITNRVVCTLPGPALHNCRLVYIRVAAPMVRACSRGDCSHDPDGKTGIWRRKTQLVLFLGLLQGLKFFLLELRLDLSSGNSFANQIN